MKANAERSAIDVAIEAAPKRVFATAVDWPGWSRSGKTEELALEALASYAVRYAPVRLRAGVEFPTPSPLEQRVIERSSGGGGTEFGVPSLVTDADRRPLSSDEAARRAALVEAAWLTFDRIAAAAPAELRKGPRGGGRDTAKVVSHVVEADHAYAREMGIRRPQPDPTDVAARRRR